MDGIAHNVTEIELATGVRVFIAPTRTQDVVCIEGSVRGGWSMLPREQSMVPSLAAELLDAGTRTRSKADVREALSLKGASLQFSAGADRIFFRGSCFPEDVPFLFQTLTECLTEAACKSSELENARKRALGELEESRTNTRLQAEQALGRMLYTKGHVHHPLTLKEQIRITEAATQKELISFRNILKNSDLILAVVGDVHPAQVRKAAEKAFGDFATRLPTQTFRPSTKPYSYGETRVPIQDKATIDTFFGAPVPLTYDSPLYIPFITFAGMLGGRGLSTGHLMRTIRERDGYTYGIYASASGFLEETEGMFCIWATFSPDTFEEAVTATRKEIAVFQAKGITEDALLNKQQEMSGRYLVSLSTTAGLAAMLHKIGVERKPLSYLDAYPLAIQAVSVADLRAAADLIPLSKLSLSAAGTFAKP